jgi:hypothetical protein
VDFGYLQGELQGGGEDGGAVRFRYFDAELLKGFHTAEEEVGNVWVDDMLAERTLLHGADG